MITTKKNQKFSVIYSNFNTIVLYLAHGIAKGFGSGLVPIMPGTAGTLCAWCVYEILNIIWPMVFTTLVWLVIISIGFVLGVLACNKIGQDLDILDHGSIVWDEIIAFWLILVFLSPADLLTQCYAFIWFRCFDIIKPPPILYFENRFYNGFGIMFDDIIAAFYTLLIFSIWRSI